MRAELYETLLETRSCSLGRQYVEELEKVPSWQMPKSVPKTQRDVKLLASSYSGSDNLGMQGLRTFSIGCLLFLSLGCAIAQPVKSSDKKDDATQESAVIQQINTSVRLENDGTGVVESMVRAKMQSQAGAQQFGLLSFPYMKDVEQLDVVSVKVRKADGAVVETPADSIQDMVSDVSHDAPFFTGLREKHVPVKSLAVGDVLEYRIKDTFNSPLIPNQFWYQHDFNVQGVVLAEEFRLDVPKNRAILLKSDKVKPVVTEEGARKIYVWKTSHLNTKERNPPVLAGHVPPSDIEVSSFRSWEELGKWMADLYKDRAVATPEITAKALQLTKDAKTEEDKIRALYSYVAMQFRYTGIAIGPGRWQPHLAADVFSNQYGDCKDKHTLLAAMLKAVGITSYPVLVNSTHVLDTEVPSPAQFDHVMTYVPRGKEAVWLDTTSEVAPYGWIMFAMRDKQGLLLDDVHPHLESVPNKKFDAWEEFHADATLSADGTLDGELSREVHGDSEMVVRALFRRVGPAQYRDLAQNISYAAGFAGNVTDVVISPIEDTATPFKFTYHYNRKNFSDWENRRITPPMPPLGLPTISEEPDKAKDPIVLGQPNTFRFYSKVKLPKDYFAQIPGNLDVSRDFAEYHAKYDFEDGVFTAERTFTIKQPIVQPEQLESYRTFQKAVSDNVDRYVILTAENKGSGNGAPVSAAHQPSPDVVELLNQARSAFEMHDMPAVIDFMHRVLEKDPLVSNGWIMLASAEMATGHMDEGIASLKKQIELSPKNLLAYRALAMTLEQRRKYDEAIPIWRKWLAVDPENTEALTHLGSLENEVKRYTDAVSDLEPAVTKDPKNGNLAALLAVAYFKSGEKEKAVKLAHATIAATPDPNTMNSIAYLLADENVELDDSLKWAKQAVESEENRRQEIDLNNLSVEDFAHVGALGAYWDTLGWVYYRRGDLAAAEKYLKAAWIVLQSYDPGSHLAEVYEKQGKKQLAAKTWAQAYVAMGRSIDDPRKHLEKMVGAAEANRLVGMAGGELSQARTMKIPSAGVGHASSDFYVLLSPGKVESVRMVNRGSSKLESALRESKFDMPFPSLGSTKIVRKGIVFCSGGPTCDVVVYPLSSSNP